MDDKCRDVFASYCISYYCPIYLDPGGYAKKILHPLGNGSDVGMGNSCKAREFLGFLGFRPTFI